MAVDKDPSIYHDRGSIGSDEDLDEYGVWVKSEPQVVTDTMGGNTGMNDEELLEPGLPDIEDLPDLALDSNDIVSDALAESEDTANSGTDNFMNDSALSEIPDLDDFDSFDLPEEEGFTDSSANDDFSADADNLSTDTIDLNEDSFDLSDMEPLDDEEQNMQEERATGDDIPTIGSDADFGDGEISLDEFGVDFDADPSGSREEAPAETADSSNEEVSMDEFIDPSDFGFDSEPATESVESEEPAMDIDLEFAEEESTNTDDFDSSDIFDNMVDETPVGTGDTMSLSGMDDLDIEEVGDFDSFLNNSETAEAPSPMAESANANIGTVNNDFEDIDIGIEMGDDGDSPFMSEDSHDDSGFDELNVRLDEEDASLDAELDAAIPDNEEHFDDLAALGRDLEESDRQKVEDRVADDDFAAALAGSSFNDEPQIPEEVDMDFPEEEESMLPAKSSDASPARLSDSPETGTSADNGNAATLSTQLLMRIADELSSIKTEITALKTELSVLKEGASVAGEQDEPSQDANGGFFADEEDEKIALTGDELDNILNTANFTEEDGADAGSNDDFAAPANIDEEDSEDTASSSLDRFDDQMEEETIELDMDRVIPENEDMAQEQDTSNAFLSDLPDILGNDEPNDEAQNRGLDSEVDVVEHIEEQPVDTMDEEIIADDEFSSDSVADEDSGELDLSESFSLDAESHEADEQLSKLAEEGVQPLTPAPEDASYLEGDVDLSQAVIEEPDLGDITLEEPAIEEPSLDEIILDEGLEVAEENFSDGPLGDMDVLEDEENISIPSGSESFEDIVPEDFAIDAGDESSDDISQEDVPLMEEADGDSGTPVLSNTESVNEELPQNLKTEVKAVLAYMDQLLESLPEDKIEEFAKSEYFDTYKKLFEELGLS